MIILKVFFTDMAQTLHKWVVVLISQEKFLDVLKLGREEVNKYGTLIKFFCEQTNVAEEEIIIPKPKPKLKTSI